jgi:hypothetical protein
MKHAALDVKPITQSHNAAAAGAAGAIFGSKSLPKMLPLKISAQYKNPRIPGKRRFAKPHIKACGGAARDKPHFAR